MTAALVALALATVADIITTIIGMGRGYRETVWMTRRMMEVAGGLWWVLKIGATAGIAVLMIWLFPSDLAPSALWGFAVAIAGAAALNLRTLTK